MPSAEYEFVSTVSRFSAPTNGSHPRIEPVSSPVSLSPEPPALREAEPTYTTGFGALSFDELYATTNRIVGYTLREKLGMTNPEDVDDCMQAGYFNVWRQLQEQPALFAGKPKKYVVQAIVWQSKVQRYAHHRHYHKLVFDADAHEAHDPHFPTPHQMETWIDLQDAIETVGKHVASLDTSLYLVALYTLLTEVPVREVASLYRHGVSTLTQARSQVRSTLAQELSDYGKLPETVGLIFPKPSRTASSRFSREPIAPKLFEDHVIFSVSRSPPRTGSVSLPPREASPAIESIPSLPEPRYPTRWRQAVTLEELLTDEQVRKVAFSKARSLGYTDQDAEDCFQLGTINLWKKLREHPNLLEDKGAAWVGVWIAFSGSRRALWKHDARSISLEDPDSDGSTPNERLILYQRNRPERWATWATRTDERIDFAILIQTLAQRYEHDSLKLLALYALTTSVKMKDVAAVAGINKKQFAAVVGNTVKQDLRQLLDEEAETNTADEYWADHLKQGENLEWITRVAERVENNQRLLLALYIVTTSVTRKDVLDLFGIGATAFRKEIIQIKALLMEEFRKGKTQMNGFISLRSYLSPLARP